MSEASWDTLIPRNTILFVGSGFSMEATNKTGKTFLDGKTLAAVLGDALGYSEQEKPPLRDVADDFLPGRQALLNQTMHPLMTTREISSDQSEIIKQPWRRVYTTNFDDVIEFGLLQQKKKPESLSFGDAVKKPARNPQVIHLHGYIHGCSDENIDEKLVLTERSYVRQLAFPRPWFDQFIDDIRFAQAVVFLGYSLADTPINALLLRAPSIKKKTSFIVRSKPDSRFERNISQYGTIRPIALNGFVNHMRILAAQPQPPRAAYFAAFTEMNPGKDKKTLNAATTVEVRNLLAYGRLNRQTCAASWPAADYVIPRKSQVDEAISAFASSRTILVHSRTGNGKTVFCEMLNVALSQKGWRCIQAKNSPILCDDDLRLLGSTQRLVLFFRTHDDAAQALSQIDKPRPDMRFVVEISTSNADVRANYLSRELVNPIHRINLNSFASQEISDFEKIMNKAGIRPRNFVKTFDRCKEMRDFILRLYDNPTIRNALLEHARPLLQVPSVRRVMTTAFALKILDLEIQPTFKREIIGEDPAATLEAVPRNLHESVYDFFEFRDASVEPYSAIVSGILLYEFVDPKDILDWALRVATIAGRRKQEQLALDQKGPRFKEAVNVLGSVLKVSALRRMLEKSPDRDEQIRSMYEEAHHRKEINSEPLFWLQFSIVLDNPNGTLKQLYDSLEHMTTAYIRADSVEGFQTYQLDTYHLRLLLHIEMHRDSIPEEIKHWSEICSLLKRFESMLLDESHRGFVLRVLENIEPFITERLDRMKPQQKSEMTDQLRSLSDSLAKRPYAVNLSESDAVRLALLRASNRLKRA